MNQSPPPIPPNTWMLLVFLSAVLLLALWIIFQ